MKRAAIYVRVSTATKARTGRDSAFEQNPEVQELPLRDLVGQRGWQLHHVYADRASGAAVDRTGLKALMADARRGKFDVVLVWRFDRFARSVEQLVTALAEFRALGVDFVSHQEALDTSTPMGKAMFTIIEVGAQRHPGARPGWPSQGRLRPRRGRRAGEDGPVAAAGCPQAGCWGTTVRRVHRAP